MGTVDFVSPRLASAPAAGIEDHRVQVPQLHRDHRLTQQVTGLGAVTSFRPYVKRSAFSSASNRGRSVVGREHSASARPSCNEKQPHAAEQIGHRFRLARPSDHQRAAARPRHHRRLEEAADRELDLALPIAHG